jgi:hypothetical protein
MATCKYNVSLYDHKQNDPVATFYVSNSKCNKDQTYTLGGGDSTFPSFTIKCPSSFNSTLNDKYTYDGYCTYNKDTLSHGSIIGIIGGSITFIIIIIILIIYWIKRRK